jgi:hypothetical protein
MTKAKLFCTITCLILLNPVAFASNEKFRVKLLVKSAEHSAAVTSYIGRELRSLNDVVMVEEHANYVISILVLQLRNRNGTNAGIAFSTMILEPYDKSFLLKSLDAKTKPFVEAHMGEVYRHPRQWINTGGNEDLQNIAKEIVADFDGQILEADRKLFREIFAPKKK